jgi:SWI/SNF-related matrix-associated actin-dependent regulator 1 of chromatin subfamily A
MVQIFICLLVDPEILAGRELLPPGRQGSNTFTTVKGIPGRGPTHVDLLASERSFEWLHLKILIPGVQFTQILDILRAIFKMQKIKYLLLTGATAVDVRQSLVDEFNENESIPCFLLSTKAGGMGINLTAASVVILCVGISFGLRCLNLPESFDQDFNPHNDKQAQDRAYRIGQKRDVDVVKLITRNSIEEDMLRLGQTKLALDEAVAGNGEEQAGEDFERKIKTSLMSALRKQLANAEAGDAEA